MTIHNTEGDGHLTVQFNLRADVANEFINGVPNEKLKKLTDLLDVYGAVVESIGKREAANAHVSGGFLKDIWDSMPPELRQRFDTKVAITLSDDRNLKRFVASLELGHYSDVIDLGTLKIVSDRYAPDEIDSARGSGVVLPLYPPADLGYRFKK